MGARVGAESQTCDVTVDPRLLQPIPTIGPIYLAKLINGIKKEFRLDGQCLETLQVIG
jgi:hypothetical protein